MSSLPTGLIVSALLRQVNDSGGMGAVRVKGDLQAGGVLVVVSGRDAVSRVLERGAGPDGTIVLIESYSGDDADSYWQRRRNRDPDLWVVELDSPLAERFAAETMLVS